MQYLLSKEEYDALHGEGDIEVEELEKKIIHLEVALKKAENGSFKQEVGDMFANARTNTYVSAEFMGAKVMEFQVRFDDLPPNLRAYISGIVKN